MPARADRFGCLLAALGPLALGASTACVPSPPPVMQRAPEPAMKDGVRQAPLTVEEVEAGVKARSSRIEACYVSEAANSRELAQYVFKLEVLPDGSPPGVAVMKKSGPEQRVLEACLIDTLRALRFPRHTGGAVVIELPVQYSGTIGSARIPIEPGTAMFAHRGAGDLR